jgi:hypothetical protein
MLESIGLWHKHVALRHGSDHALYSFTAKFYAAGFGGRPAPFSAPRFNPSPNMQSCDRSARLYDQNFHTPRKCRATSLQTFLCINLNVLAPRLISCSASYLQVLKISTRHDENYSTFERSIYCQYYGAAYRTQFQYCAPRRPS